MHKTVSQIVTEKILGELEKGVLPWERPWIIIHKQNFVTKRPYRGINRLLLSLETEEYYITFTQIMKLKGRLKAGSKARLVIFWKPVKIEQDTEKDTPEKTVPLLRYYRVFRLQDTDIKRPIVIKNPFSKKLNEIENFIQKINPKIEIGGSRACYKPDEDKICIPQIERFNDTNHYYSTLMHELIHWSGAKHRLNRFSESEKNYNEDYGREELVAELGASMLSHYFGISLPKHNAGYIDGWIKAIKGERNLLIGAASRAEKSVAYLGLQI